MAFHGAREDACARVVQAHARRYLCRCLDGRGAHGGDCPICTDAIAHGVCLPCGHSFHLHCISKWVSCEPSCPMCRSSTRDGKVDRLRRRMEAYREFFALPVESHLGFRASLPLALLTDLPSREQQGPAVGAFLRRARRSAGSVDMPTLQAMEARWEVLGTLRRAIQVFDACRPAAPEGGDPSLLLIHRRLSLPFEHLHARVTDPWRELAYLKRNTDLFARALRHRLCQLWWIEQTIRTGYEAGPTAVPPARSLVTNLMQHRSRAPDPPWMLAPAMGWP